MVLVKSGMSCLDVSVVIFVSVVGVGRDPGG